MNYVNLHFKTLGAPFHRLKFQAVSLLLLSGCRSQQQREPERQITVVHTGEAGNIDRSRGAEQQHHASFSFVQMPGVLLFTDHSTTTQLPFTREQEEGEGRRGLAPSATTTLSPAGRRRQARFALVKYGGRSPKFIWAPCHVMCTAVLIG